jgi:transcriptional regulator with XRE-family HTH domain
MTTAAALKRIRRKYGESQQAFATRLGISIRALANYEAGTRIGSMPVLYWLFREGVLMADDEIARTTLERIIRKLGIREADIWLLEPWFHRVFALWPKPEQDATARNTVQ